MKKLLICFAAILFSIPIFAQEHISFKGIPLGGGITEFASKLEEMGYTKIVEAPDRVVLTGEFAGKSDCNIFILPAGDDRLVWKVAVQFPKNTSWISLKNEYKSFKKSYIDKYGEPAKVWEFFNKPYRDGDGHEMTALRVNKCMYYCSFKTDGGIISLKISSPGFVMAGYEDTATVQIKNQSDDSKISDDI